MAGLIDWQIGRTPAPPDQGPGAEVASLNTMLSLLAQRREQARQFQQQQDFNEWQEKAVQENRAADNALNIRRQKELKDYQDRQLEQQQAHHEAQALAAAQTAAIPGEAKMRAEMALHNIPGAAAAAAAHGIEFGPTQPKLVDVPERDPDPPVRLPPLPPVAPPAATEPPAFTEAPAAPGLPPPAAPGQAMGKAEHDAYVARFPAPPPPDLGQYPNPFVAEDNAADSAAAMDRQATAAQMAPSEQTLDDAKMDAVDAQMPYFAALNQNKAATEAVRGSYTGRMPAGQEFFMSAKDDALARLAHTKQAREEFAGAMGHLATDGTPHEQEAYRRTMDLIGTTQLPPEKMEIVKFYAKTEQSLRNNDITREQAGANREGVEQRARTSEGFRALSEHRREVKDFEVENQVPILKKKAAELKMVRTMFESGTGPGQLSALEAHFRGTRGGMLTAYFLKAAMEHMSGMYGRVQTAIAKFKNGTMGESDKEALDITFAAAEAAHREHIEGVRQAFVDRFMNDTVYPLKQNVIGEYNSTFVPFGLPRMTNAEAAPGVDAMGHPVAPRAPQTTETRQIGSRKFGSKAPTGVPAPTGPTEQDKIKALLEITRELKRLRGQ